MAFEKFNKDMKIISALDDEPNDVGGLTAAELKAKFDEGGEAIKRYLNDTLIPAVVADGATEEHRAETEAARVAAEQTRQSNEETRQANETSRISAENARNVWENYDASKTYAVGNKVAYGGSSYLCIKPCTGIAPPSAEYWLLIAKKGDKGDKGETGGKGAAGKDGTTPHIGSNGNWYIGDTDTGVSAGGASHIFEVIVGDGTGGPDTLSANKTFAEIKSAYFSGSMVVVQQGSALYELTYMSNTRAEFTRVSATYYDVLSCINSGAPSEADLWQLNRTKRVNYDTKYGDIGQKTVPAAIKELQDKSAPAVMDADAGKYLHVNASTKELEWAEVESGGGSDLPAVTAADAGKFLRVSSSGSWVAETVANANGGEF